MAISINLNADGSGNGVDFQSMLDDFDANFSRGSFNYGEFLNGSGLFEGEQYFLSDQDSGTSYTGGFLASSDSGTDFSYDISTHEIVGELDELSFGETTAQDANGDYYLTDSSVDISGLDLSSSETGAVLTDMFLGGTSELQSVFASEGVEINGSAGDDVIGGWAGDDVLTGNGGADTFEFDSSSDFGDDVVTDFDDGTDLIGGLDYNDVTITDDGSGNALITHANGTVTLTGVDFADIDQNDFV
ncbi:calcium-binding protein [Thalassospira sp. MA62]|nr:calcium-binding protein [Thalassospira sp. MA62]